MAVAGLPAAGDEVKRTTQQALAGRHICRIQNQTIFQAPSGAKYVAPTGLRNWVVRMATNISLLTELWWTCQASTPKELNHSARCWLMQSGYTGGKIEWRTTLKELHWCGGKFDLTTSELMNLGNGSEGRRSSPVRLGPPTLGNGFESRWDRRQKGACVSGDR